MSSSGDKNQLRGSVWKRRVSIGEYYKETRAEPKYQTPSTSTIKEEEKELEVKPRSFEFQYPNRSRMLGVCKFIESVIKSSMIEMERKKGNNTSQVAKPETININEWLAANLVVIHNFANRLYLKYCEKPLLPEQPNRIKNPERMNQSCL